MGKRELLLIAGFLLVGTAVYFVTAPPPTPGQQGFSLGRILDEVRREVRGHQASAEVRTSTTRPLTAGVKEIRVQPGNATVSLIGEDRSDIAFDLLVWSNGYDEDEARKYAAATNLEFTEVGTSLGVAIDYPQPAQQRATLTVRIPEGLEVRVQPSRGKLDISDLERVELAEARGQVTVRNISERLAVTHRGGTLTLEAIAALKLNTRGSVVKLKNVHGEAMLQMQAGELHASAIQGPLEIESNGTEIHFDDLPWFDRTVRLTTVGGSVTLKGVASPFRLDARDTRIDLTIDKAATIDVYGEGDEPLLVTLPESGYTLDAIALESRVHLPPGLSGLKLTSSETEQRVSGTVGSGSSRITIRSSRGDITFRSRTPET